MKKLYRHMIPTGMIISLTVILLLAAPLQAQEVNDMKLNNTATITGGLKYTTFSAEKVEQTVGISLAADYGLRDDIMAGLNYSYLPASIEIKLDETDSDGEEYKYDDLSLHGIAGSLSYDISRLFRAGKDEDEGAFNFGSPRNRQLLEATAGYYQGTVAGDDSYELAGKFGGSFSLRMLHRLADSVVIDAEVGYRYLDMEVPAGYEEVNDFDLSGLIISMGLGYQF